VVTQEVVFGNAELEVENIKEFTLNAADIPFSEYASAERPVDVLECGVIKILMME